MTKTQLLILVAALAPQLLSAQAPPRAIRRDIPMTNAIRRAHGAGARDSTGRPGRNYWQLRTDYTINARLDVATSRIHGRETVVIHNTGPDSLSTIGLRLDPNIFLWNTPLAAPWVPSEQTDGMIITRMTVDGVPVNLGGGQLQQNQLPSEPLAFQLNTTRATIALAKRIAARSKATLEIEWNHKLPGSPGGWAHRMAQRWADTLYQPTQWYPRVAVYDDLRGWDPEIYLGPAEFYNNFGRFDVRIDVPAGWIVSGTGVLQNPQEVLTPTARARLAQALQSDSVTIIVGPDEIGPGQATAAGDRLTWHFVADTVNDFAWATAKKYVWKATRANIPGKGYVPIHMVHLPGRGNLYANAATITRHALEFYSQLWFPYPFPQLTLQDGPSAGMEYPMVINSNQGAADHEAAHQWWPMTVSNNETWYGWMDEGFNQYMNILSRADVQKQVPNLDRAGQQYGSISGSEAEAPMMWNSNYGGPQFWSFMTYSKTPLMLSMLGGIVGDTAVWNAHRAWAKDWMFKHPSPWDYMFHMSRTLGVGHWFWYYWLFTTESVDGSIEKSVSNSAGRTVVTVRQDGQMPSPVILRVQFAATGPAIRPMANAVKIDDRTYDVTFPVDVWFDGKRSYDAVLNFGPRSIEKITLDPRARFPDRNPADNVWPR